MGYGMTAFFRCCSIRIQCLYGSLRNIKSKRVLLICQSEVRDIVLGKESANRTRMDIKRKT
jgi:hypothetical protein